jgi:hypothetical protein
MVRPKFLFLFLIERMMMHACMHASYRPIFMQRIGLYAIQDSLNNHVQVASLEADRYVE